MSCFCQAVMSVYLRRGALAMRHEMSKSALERHEVVSQIKCGALKGVECARRLQISPRQMRRIVLRFEQGGMESLNNSRYGQKPGNVMSSTTRTFILGGFKYQVQHLY
jgi:Winged helix-turn helix